MFKMPAETRGAFRVYPSSQKPIVLVVGTTTLNAVDISSGGISFENKGFKSGTVYPMKISFPDIKSEVSVKTKILKIDDKNICRCSILEINEEEEDAIHSYVLSRQKEELAERKNKYQ